jgi:hypothetical protein
MKETKVMQDTREAVAVGVPKLAIERDAGSPTSTFSPILFHGNGFH